MGLSMTMWVGLLTVSTANSASDSGGSSSEAPTVPSVHTRNEPPWSAQKEPLRVDVAIDATNLVGTPGLGLSLKFRREDSRFRAGAVFQTAQLPEFARDQFFGGSVDPDALTIDWDLAFSAELDAFACTDARWYCGGFARLGLGYETWNVALGEDSVDIFNSFAVAGVGFQWFPWDDLGLYVEPAINVIVLFGQDDGYAIGDETVELTELTFGQALRFGWGF